MASHVMFVLSLGVGISVMRLLPVQVADDEDVVREEQHAAFVVSDRKNGEALTQVDVPRAVKSTDPSQSAS